MCHIGTMLPATHACMLSNNPPHRHARGCMPSHTLLHMLSLPHGHACRCKICCTGMHARHYLPHRQACNCMQPYILQHMLYLPHKHKYICIICHTSMHAITYSGKQGVSATRHACRRTICYTSCRCHACSRIICYASWMCPMHGILCLIGRHAAACSRKFYYTCCICQTNMNTFA